MSVVEIHLYGPLRRYGEQPHADRPTVIHLPIEGTPDIGQVLEQAGIAPEEVSQVFLNGKLLNTSSKMASWLGYPTERERLPASGTYLETPIRSGDRLGLFPSSMSLLVI